jgi:hypothetical protein
LDAVQRRGGDGRQRRAVVVGRAAPDARKIDVFGQRFSLRPLGGEFQINTYTTSYQDAPA